MPRILRTVLALTLAAAAPALAGCILGGGGGKGGNEPVTLAGGATTAAAISERGNTQSAQLQGVKLLAIFQQGPAGRVLTALDEVYGDRAAQVALENDRSGIERPWTNPQTGTVGAVKPTRTYQEADGTYCREYVLTVAGRIKPADQPVTAEARGVACRRADGTWKYLP